jgi:SAM-dependent methyltransferase
MSEFERYDRQFYEARSDGSLRSARVIIPILLQYFSVESVVDIGCGIGAWLKVFEENRVPHILGVDGPHIDRAMLATQSKEFLAVDLRTELRLVNRYDLAMSLEVAEHLPEELSTNFVTKLTEAAPIVLFSAAVPGQPGVAHINMQWQDYWRTIFGDRGYVALDIIRPAVWGRADVDYWYQQNTIVYCHNSIAATRSDLPWASEKTSLNMVHPALYEQKTKEYEEAIRRLSKPGLSKTIRSIPGLAIKTLRRQLNS